MEIGRIIFLTLVICSVSDAGRTKKISKPPVTESPSWEDTVIKALPEKLQPYAQNAFKMMDTVVNETIVVFHELCGPCYTGYGALRDFIVKEPYVRSTLTAGCTLVMPIFPVLTPVCQAAVASGLFLIQITPAKYVCGSMPVCWGVDQSNMTAQHVRMEQLVNGAVEAFHNISQIIPVFHPIIQTYAKEIASSPTYSYLNSLFQDLEKPLMELLGVKDSNDILILLTTQVPIQSSTSQ
ncbi:hypothetical protein FO519_001651 [Halicephalobus sp. NKZ332]|nr:hypothetical protein FO519_001651 [Halicephalobus sp. NKZ332]